jgi:hypothetical protein
MPAQPGLPDGSAGEGLTMATPRKPGAKRGRPRKWETCPRCGGVADEFAEVYWPRDVIAKLHVTLYWKCAGCAAEWGEGYMIRPPVRQGRRRQRL